MIAMCGEKYKLNFISSYTSSSRLHTYIKQLFEKFREIEMQTRQDLCELPESDIRNVIDAMEDDKAAKALIVIRDYVEWRIKLARHSQVSCNINKGILAMETNVIKKTRETMISDPLHLQKKLDRAFPYEISGTIDCLYRVYAWLVYAGMKEEETVKVERSAVDLDEMVVRHNGEAYEIYGFAKEAFEKALALQAFKFLHGNTEYNLSRAFSSKLLGGSDDERYNSNVKNSIDENGAIKLSSIHTKLSKISAAPKGDDSINTDVKLSYKRIYESGLFHRIWIDEINGLTRTYDKHIKSEYPERNTDQTDKNRKMHIEESIRRTDTSYKMWKIAFK